MLLEERAAATYLSHLAARSFCWARLGWLLVWMLLCEMSVRALDLVGAGVWPAEHAIRSRVRKALARYPPPTGCATSKDQSHGRAGAYEGPAVVASAARPPPQATAGD